MELPDAAVTGNDVTTSNVTGSDVTGGGPDRKRRHNLKYALRMPGFFFPLFSYYSSSTKFTIAHHRK